MIPRESIRHMYYIRENLAVCGFHHIGTRESFQSHGFRVQLQCADAYDAWLAEYVEVLKRPFDDGIAVPQDLFVSAQNWLGERWDAGAKILISCAAGHSRSVTMAIALLSRKAGLSFIEATRDVIRRVPGAYPHPHVLASAARHSDAPLRSAEMEAIYAGVADPPRYPWSVELIREAAGR